MLCNFNKKLDYNLVIQERENFLTILKIILDILNKSGNSSQAIFIKKLVDNINEGDIDQFVRSINSVDMWGGAGAVWEVYIDDNFDATIFKSQIIRLINLMEDVKILGKGIKPIRKLMVNNIV